MIDLTRTTLCAISSVKIPQTIKALAICQQDCKFNNILFFSDQDVPHNIKISKINSISDYNYFVLHKLPELILPIMADFVLTVHWDGFIINPTSWTDNFYNYDYIGAPWPWFRHICGNGGFCLKSKKFVQTQKDIISHKVYSRKNEDIVLCKMFRNEFDKHGCKYANPKTAYAFSTEYPSGDPKFTFEKPFGFHDFKYHPHLQKFIEE
jgi:hypothetical protein